MTARALAQPAPDSRIVRRACACAAKSGPSGCPECDRKKKVMPKLVIGSAHAPEEVEADRVADTVMRGGPGAAAGSVGVSVQREEAGHGTEGAAPAIVDRVLHRPGEALEPGARRFFESRFRRDFSNVRIHADGEAAASAQAVDAHAYTVGNHIVFGASRYAAGDAAGRRLLAHELTHVVQQGETLRRESISPSVIAAVGPGREEDEDSEKQPVQRLRRHVAIVGDDEAGPNANLTDSEGDRQWRLAEQARRLAECKKAAKDPEPCNPTTPPGWDSFTGKVDAGSTFSASTFSTIVAVDVPSQLCEEKETGFASGPKKRFQGLFDPAQSWVQTQFVDALDPAKNGSAKLIGDCETALPPGTTGKVKMEVAEGKGPHCAASVRPRGDTATKNEECATVVGKDFNDFKAGESMRLLRHEQQHLALTCAMAAKGNDAIAAHGFDAVDKVIHTKLAALQRKYDGEANHGCIASGQATWEAAITKGLPDVKLF